MRGVSRCRPEAGEEAAEAAELDPKLAREAAKLAREAAKLAREAAKLAVRCAVCEEPAKSSWLECPSCTARTHLPCLASHFIQVRHPCCALALPTQHQSCAHLHASPVKPSTEAAGGHHPFQRNKARRASQAAGELCTGGTRHALAWKFEECSSTWCLLILAAVLSCSVRAAVAGLRLFQGAVQDHLFGPQSNVPHPVLCV